MKILKAIVLIVFFLVALLYFSVAPIDRTPYTEMSYYKEMCNKVQAFHIVKKDKKGDSLKVGWSTASILPDQLPYPIAGYGIRKPAQSVLDTIKVRTFVFDNSQTRVAFVVLDILIFPPEIKEYLYQTLKKKYQIEFYLTASHTHSSAGGWLEKWAGHFIAGKYNDEYVKLLENQIDKSINSAIKNISLCSYSNFKFASKNAVVNRLRNEQGIVDDTIRGVVFKNKWNKKALLYTFSAHAVCHDSDVEFLSGDYPNAIEFNLKKSKEYEVIAYAAGAVASHSPGFLDIHDGYQKYLTMGKYLAHQIDTCFKSKEQYTTQLYYTSIPLSLREAHIKLNNNYRLRPWLFHMLLGKSEPTIELFQVGHLVFLGMPCDYSGELMPPLLAKAKTYNQELLLTGFNGGYIGYITVDQCYDWDRGETRDMNWFGPYNAAYLTEINLKLLEALNN
jgi:hypothetical protein